jgi:hypothetical protein
VATSLVTLHTLAPRLRSHLLQTLVRWAKRWTLSKPSRTCHRRLGSVDERPSVGVQAFLLQAISCDALGDAGVAR